MAEHADACPHPAAVGQRRGLAAVVDASGRGSEQGGEDGQERRLAGAVGPEQPDDVAGRGREGDVGQRPPPPVVPSDAHRGDTVEVGGHAAVPEPPGSRSSLGVDLLGGGHQPFALGRRAGILAPRPALGVDGRDRAEQTLALLDQSVARHLGLGRSAPHRPRRPEGEQRRQRQGDVARPGGRRRQPRELQGERLAFGEAAGGAHHEDLAVRFALAAGGELRRRQGQGADLLDGHQRALDRRRPRLVDPHGRGERQAVGHLERGRPRGERPGQGEPAILHPGDRRRP